MRQSGLVALAIAMALGGCGGGGGGSMRETAADQQAAQALNTLPPAPADLDPAKVLAHADWLSRPEMKGRMTAEGGDEAATQYAEAHFKALGLATTRQPFKGRFDGTAANLVALLPAAAPTDRYVVVGAHKDHIGVSWSGKVYAGANDNASGVSGVLEIARALKARFPQGLKANVLFVLFSGEELGLLGSDFYTDHPIAPNADGSATPIKLTQMNGMVNLDVIAVGHPDKLGIDDGVNMADGGPKAILTRSTLQKLAGGRGLHPTFQPFPKDHLHGLKLPSWASSDHASFRRKGVWAVIYYGEPAASKSLHTADDNVPVRDTHKKAIVDVFSPELLVRVAGVGLDTAITLSETGKPPKV